MTRLPARNPWASAVRNLALAITIGIWGVLAQAQQAGVVTHLSGTLSVKRAEAPPKLLAVKSEVKEGDLLTTEAETYARIKFVDGGEVVLRPGSQLKVESYAYNPAKPESDNIGLSMLKGGLRAVTGLVGKRNKDKVNYTTATATIGIRGTHFGALLCQGDCGNVPTTTGVPPANGLHLDVADGAILVRNAAGQQQINAGQFGYVASAQVPPQVVPPQQGIQVTMPPAISQNKGAGQGIGKGKESECAM
ncbi:MAG: FecR domain-containing protein [Rhodocyclales bacterium]|nr:FecR domain-containing protein [Rhodocyclales bacterium]